MYKNTCSYVIMSVRKQNIHVRTDDRRRKMEFRPCIDIHNGSVKQIVGGSLRDRGDEAVENYVSKQDAAFYAGLYREYKILLQSCTK